jgi:hypothetical protein
MFSRLNSMRYSIVLAALVVAQPFLVAVRGMNTCAWSTSLRQCLDGSAPAQSPAPRNQQNDGREPANRFPTAEQCFHDVDAAIRGRRTNELVDSISHNYGLDSVVESLTVTNSRAETVPPQLADRTCRIVPFEHSVAPIHETRGQPRVRSSLACKSQDVHLTFVLREVSKHGQQVDSQVCLAFYSSIVCIGRHQPDRPGMRVRPGSACIAAAILRGSV